MVNGTKRLSEDSSKAPLTHERISAFGNDKRQQSDCSGSLDGQCQFTLMDGAIPRNSAGHDFSAFRDEVSQRHGIFIITLDR